MLTLSPGLLLVVLFGLCSLSFLLGWDIAESREREAKRILDGNLKLAIRQKRELTKWIGENWPSEFDAYRRGHLEGYQQGISQSAELEADQT